MPVLLLFSTNAAAGTRTVCSSGCEFSDLQAAINAAVPGDTLLLRAGETFVGPFSLPLKGSSTDFITIRSDASDAQLPAPGVRLVPSGRAGANTDLALLPRLVGRGGAYKTTPVISTQPGAHHYVLRFLNVDGSAAGGHETLIAVGTDTTAAAASDIIIDRVYAHGHAYKGQKRGIALNGASTEIIDSYLSDFKAMYADAQAIAGYNGAGPFKIVNNYIEGTGENILFGGSDPAVYNLVPSGIEIRRNLITKPIQWREAILAPPGGVRAADAGAGSLYGTQYFKVAAVMDAGPEIVLSTGSTEAAIGLGSARAAAVTWTAVPGADRYRVYRGTSPGAQTAYVETAAAVTSLTYTGSGEWSGGPPSAGTKWTVKNIIELKNAQDVTVDGNILENIWAAGQAGYAITLTPRNQDGGAPWVRVRDVTFSNNIIRHAAGVLLVSGYDDIAVSQQTQRIAFRNNLMHDIDPVAWGSAPKTFLIGDGAASIAIDHNTIVQSNTSFVYAYGTQQITGFSFTNNVTLHNEYGIMGESGRPGNYTIAKYFPYSNISYNVIAGGAASDYPATNTFPSIAEWNAAWVDPASGNFRLRTTASFYAAGEGGSVPGVNFDALDAALAVTTAPLPTAPTPAPPPANTPPVARAGGPYSASIGTAVNVDGSASSDADGGVARFLWQWGDEIIVRAADIAAGDIVGTAWTRVAAADAAGGYAIHNPDRGAGKASSAAAAPASYVDVRFYAAAGVPYHLWIRAQAQNNSYSNDSMFLQFSGRVDANGSPVDRIGTTSAKGYVLEEGAGAGLGAWGWNDEAYGSVADPVYFATSGIQTIRIQQREDGIMWDQIVLSAVRYAAASPGSTRFDSTILADTLGADLTALASHTYKHAAVYPLRLTVWDGNGASAVADTTVTVGSGTSSALVARPGGPYSGSVNQSLSFDGTGSSASGSAQYFWKFGDEVVLDPGELAVVGSRWRRVSDSSAAGGVALENPDLGEAKLATANAAPESYIEARFKVAAGVPYRLWIRMRAANDAYTNDSIYVQFSGSVTQSGTATARLGTTDALGVVLEDGGGMGVLGWGWTDSAYGTLGAPVYFNSDGEQRIRIQQREDGVRIDQIVLSAADYATRSPGYTKQDTTIVPVFPNDARGPIVTRSFGIAGVFPVEFTITDGVSVAAAGTDVTIR